MKMNSLTDLERLLTDEERSALRTAAAVKGHDGKGRSVRVYLDNRNRKGKTVTVVADLQHNPQTMEELARTLKQHCGAGGTVKDGLIEIQGDQRAKAKEKLLALNYRVR